MIVLLAGMPEFRKGRVAKQKADKDESKILHGKGAVTIVFDLCS